MTWERRTTATEHGISSARNIPGAETLVPVSYMWSDQFECNVQIHGSFRGADGSAVIDGSVTSRRAYGTVWER